MSDTPPAAASDDDDTPSAAAAAVPEASKGWNKQDRRTLVITIGGTLAANLATVILVGGALAFVHLNHGAAPSRLLVATLGVMAAGLVSIVLGTVSRRLRKFYAEAGRPEIGSAFLRYGWILIVVGWLAELVAVMILIGLAAGVK